MPPIRDPSTLAAVSYLLRRCADTALAIVGGFRSEEVAPDHPLRLLPAAAAIDLAPLTRADLERGELEDLHERTGGNPLFLVEYLRSANEEGGAPEEVPTSLRDLLSARARAAGPRARRLDAAHPDLLEPPAREALLLRLGRLLVTVGRSDEGEIHLRAALESAGARGDDPASFDALEALTIAGQRGASDATDAFRHAERAMAVARRLDDQPILERAHTLLGSSLGSLGRIDGAMDSCAAAIRLAEDSGRSPAAFPIGRMALMRMHALDAEIALVEGDPERARGAAGACLALAEKHGLPRYLVRGRLARGRALAAGKKRPPAAALAEIRAAALGAEELGFPGLAWRCHLTAHELGGSEADLSRAQEQVARAAAGLGGALRRDFLAAVPVPP